MSLTDDRATVLRRRAAFLSSALGVISCSGASSVAPPSPPAPVDVVAPPASAQPSPDDLPESKEPPKPAAGDMPSLEIPADAEDRAREAFESLIKRVKAVHVALDELNNQVPDCAIGVAACADKWRTFAGRYTSAQALMHLWGPLCRGTSDAAKLVAQRSREHREYIQRRFKDLDSALYSRLGTQDARAKWEELLVQHAQPAPCLSIACNPDW